MTGLHHQPGDYDTDTLIGVGVLGQLRRFVGGQKTTLLWASLKGGAGQPGRRHHHLAFSFLRSCGLSLWWVATGPASQGL